VTEALGNMGIKIEGTRSWQLQPLSKEHPAIEKLLEYRSVQKAAFKLRVGAARTHQSSDWTIHADFRQMGATGGRMSCSDRNPSRFPTHRSFVLFVRRQAVSPRDRGLSQIELRILADWSQDNRAG